MTINIESVYLNKEEEETVERALQMAKDFLEPDATSNLGRIHIPEHMRDFRILIEAWSLMDDVVLIADLGMMSKYHENNSRAMRRKIKKLYIEKEKLAKFGQLIAVSERDEE